MITKNDAKLVVSLQNKKFRQKYNLFLVEGIKSVQELIAYKHPIQELFYTNGNWPNFFADAKLITPRQLQQISALKNPNQVLAVCPIPKPKTFKKSNGLTLVLDNIRDPGNLGTIIRLAHWFGIQQILCSKTSVDCYNPKCIQASMASFLVVDVFYADLTPILNKSQTKVIGTFMNGDNLYQNPIPKNAYLILGNEHNGISGPITQLCKQKLSIPKLAQKQTAESLNIAMACAVFLSEYARHNQQ